MTSIKSQFGLNRPYKQREALYEKFKRTQPTGGISPHINPFAASREHHLRLGFTVRHWQPAPDDSGIHHPQSAVPDASTPGPLASDSQSGG